MITIGVVHVRNARVEVQGKYKRELRSHAPPCASLRAVGFAENHSLAILLSIFAIGERGSEKLLSKSMTTK